MSSLYRRANGPQFRMLTIVSGAVLNAAHAHPGHAVDKRFARSVSKRAVGTISASWPELLAAPSPSGAGRSGNSPLRNGSDHLKARGGRLSPSADPRFISVIRDISKLIKPAKEAGQVERVQALINALRIIDRVVKQRAPA